MNVITYSITGFRNVLEPNNQTKLQLTWEQLKNFLFHPREPIENKKLQSAWSPAIFSGRRANENVEELSLLVADVDHGLSWEEVEECLSENRIRSLMYSSFSHRVATESNPKAEDRFRVVFPLSKPVPRRFWKYYHLALRSWFRDTFGSEIDGSTSDPCRCYYLGYKTETYQTASLSGDGSGSIYWDRMSHEEYKRIQEEIREAERIARERREKYRAHRENMQKEHRSFRDERRYNYEMMATQSDWRTTLAHRLGAKIVDGRAVEFDCPFCQRDDCTFFYIDPAPNVASGFCGHKKSCGDGDFRTFSLGYLAEANGLL